MKTFSRSTVTTALNCNLSRKEISDQPHASAASTLGKDPQHPLNRRPDVTRAGLMFWIESKYLASANKQTTYGPASRLSLH
jgi:hypothetical protein